MTADGDEVREALGAAMAAQHSCDTLLSTSGRPCNRCRQSANGVLPVVEAHARRFAAQVLEAAAAEQRAEAEQIPAGWPGTHADGHLCAAEFLDVRARILLE